MTMTIKQDSYYVGFWFVGDGETRDWFAILRRDPGADRFTLDYRFRYYTGDQTKDTFNDGDDKSFWTATLPPDASEPAAIEIVAGLVEDLVQKGFGTNPVQTLVQGNGEAMIAAFAKAPFVHLTSLEGLAAEPTAKGGDA